MKSSLGIFRHALNGARQITPPARCDQRRQGGRVLRTLFWERRMWVGGIGMPFWLCCNIRLLYRSFNNRHRTMALIFSRHTSSPLPVEVITVTLQNFLVISKSACAASHIDNRGSNPRRAMPCGRLLRQRQSHAGPSIDYYSCRDSDS
ncbi:hypothetical protein CALVIDRAFT_306380 [Calocera viscosa TUFC12733]|uniref:Uncharacterized protein n=1 Tax=Calocera viscosa (strain TUFC12733) TaxID=1330018 RepID=A0A167IAF9_CALVF|nr:hypothetical protein CALVIDRAFT_306380 [Calocera viscosa TUFC12733]